MSIEENLIKIVGISVVSFYCIKSLIIAGIDTYKEVYGKLHQSIKEIKDSNRETDIQISLDEQKLYNERIK